MDIYYGSGGAPEGVLAAAALRCIGGQMSGKLIFRNEDEKWDKKIDFVHCRRNKPWRNYIFFSL